MCSQLHGVPVEIFLSPKTIAWNTTFVRFSHTAKEDTLSCPILGEVSKAWLEECAKVLPNLQNLKTS